MTKNGSEKNMQRQNLLVAGVLALALAAPAAATDGYFMNGAGGKAKGMAGVAIAAPLDAFAMSANPASATGLGERLDVGFEVFVPKRGADISGNRAGLDGQWSGNSANPFVLPEGAYVRPLGERVSVGIAIHANGGMNTTYKENPFASFGATGPAGVDLRQIFITPTLAVRLADGRFAQSVGVSPIFLVQGFEMKGIGPFAAASADPEHLSDNGRSWSTGVGARVGWLGHFGDEVTLGAFYQTKVWAGRFKKYAGLFADRGSFDVPSAWGAGIAVKPLPVLTFGADFKRINYRGVKAVGTPLAPLLQGVPFGAAGGPGFGWRDIDVVKFGANWDVSPRVAVRAGWGHAENPVPRGETFLNILAPGVVTDHWTAGATVKVAPKVEITGYLMVAPKQWVRGANSIPAPYGGGEADVHLSEAAGGLSLGVLF